MVRGEDLSAPPSRDVPVTTTQDVEEFGALA